MKFLRVFLLLGPVALPAFAFAQIPPAPTLPLSGNEIVTCIQANVPKGCTTGEIGTVVGSAQFAPNNSFLAATSAMSFPNGLLRTGYSSSGDAKSVLFVPQTGTCTANGGLNDGGLCVNDAVGNSFLAVVDGPLDVRNFGKTYPINLYADAASANDRSGKNSCTDSANPCSGQGAINKAYGFDSKGQNVTINFAADASSPTTYDHSLFIQGLLPGQPSRNGRTQTDGGLLVLKGPSSPAVTIDPTVGGGGCAENYGDGVTLSSHAIVFSTNLTWGTACPGRSAWFLQNYAYMGVGPGNTMISSSVEDIHIEAFAYAEDYGGNLINVAAQSGTALVGLSTQGLMNFDGAGSGLNFTGNVTFSSGLFAAGAGSRVTMLSGTAFTLNGHTVSGPAYAVNDNGSIINASGSSIPGAQGLTNEGGLYTDGVIVGPFQWGSTSGSATSPSAYTTNFEPYYISATNWNGMGADGSGDLFFVTGVGGGGRLNPSSRMVIGFQGGVIIGDPNSLTQLGDATLNVGNTIALNGQTIAGLNNGKATIGLGGAGGTLASPTDATTNILLYHNSSTNYAGFMVGSDGSICSVIANGGTPLCGLVVSSVGGLSVGLGSAAGAGNVNIAGTYLVNGSQIACANLALSCSNGSNITSGVVGVGVGGTGQTTYTNGQLLIGNTTGNTLAKAALTAGNGITITNGAGSITVTNGAASVTGAVKSNGSGTFTQAACADLSNGATGCTVPVTGKTSWTPTLLGDGTAGAPTYTTQVGTYIKTDKWITAQFFITITSLGGATGNLELGGLPVASSATTGSNGGCQLFRLGNWTGQAGYTGLAAQITPGGSVGLFVENGSGKAVSQAATTEFAATTTMAGICNYPTDS